MPVSLGDLPGAAQALLEQIEDALVTLQGGAFLPTNQLGSVVAYLAPGSQVAYDSAGLVVNLVTVRPGAPGQPISTFIHWQAMTQSAQFAITLLRECSTLNDDGIPTPATINDDAVTSLTDAQALWQAMVDVMAGYKWTEPGVPIAIVGCDSLGPEGGLIAARLTVEVSLS
jgi:hypothetical protein